MNHDVLRAAGAAAFAVSLAWGSVAGAASLSLSGGTPGSIPAAGQTNEVLNDLGEAPLGGFFGSTVSIDGPGTVRAEFLGFEAGYQNQFLFGGSGFDTEDYAPSQVRVPSSFGAYPSYTVNVGAAGALAFSFLTDGGTGTNGTYSVDNGSNPDNSGSNAADVNFFASIVGNYVWLFFDDNGANNDDNHDDMAVRLSVVPLPAAGVLLLTALGGLGFVGRFRRQAA